MQCPQELSEVLLEMLRIGLLRVRAAAWSGRADVCAVEADHLHNLPELLSDFSLEKLQYYMHAEKPGYISQCSALKAGVEDFEPMWRFLGRQISKMESMALTS
jgi:hypothetical protein